MLLNIIKHVLDKSITIKNITTLGEVNEWIEKV